MPVSLTHIIDALSALGGEAHLDRIVAQVREIAPDPLPADVGASVRGRIQERCFEAASFKGGQPVFESVHGILARRGVWRLRADALSPTNSDLAQDDADAFVDAPEGRAQLRLHLRRERSQKLIRAFKSGLTKFSCEACGFNFEETYGPPGLGYIEAHHVVPVASLDKTSKTKLADLVALCANCHRVVHRNNLMPVEALRATLARKRNIR